MLHIDGRYLASHVKIQTKYFGIVRTSPIMVCCVQILVALNDPVARSITRLLCQSEPSLERFLLVQK